MNGTENPLSIPALTHIPSYLQGVTATAVALFTREGSLIDGNMGFFRLLPGDLSAGDLLDIRSLFLNPRFDQFAARRSDVTGGIVYEGVFNFGGLPSVAVSLFGSLYEYGKDLLLVAEQDVAQLEKQLATLQLLNEKLSEQAREMARLKRKLEHQEATKQGALADREILLDLLHQNTQETKGADAPDASDELGKPPELPKSLVIDWSEEMCTGITALDAEHKELVRRYYSIVNSLKEKKDLSHFKSQLREFVEAAARHFGHEERVMKTTGFPQYLAHKEGHDQLLKDADDFLASIGTALPLRDCPAIAKYVRHWLMRHMREQDREIHAFITQ